MILCKLWLSYGDRRRWFERRQPLAETGFHAVRICGRQSVLGRKVVVDPVRRLIRRLKPIEVGN